MYYDYLNINDLKTKYLKIQKIKKLQDIYPNIFNDLFQFGHKGFC